MIHVAREAQALTRLILGVAYMRAAAVPPRRWVAEELQVEQARRRTTWAQKWREGEYSSQRRWGTLRQKGRVMNAGPRDSRLSARAVRGQKLQGRLLARYNVCRQTERQPV